ncbi:MAG: EAL domain-containing protein [Lachnospiraceae bacterium]|nr:EAL domain-containing protein [Lachnospiraceae bacterium]
MDRNISFDIAAIFLLYLLLLSTIFRKMTRSLTDRVFLASVVCAIFSSHFDILAVFLDSTGCRSPFLLYFAHTGYLMIHNAQTPLHIIFVVSLTDTWHRVQKNRWLRTMLWLPYSLTFLLLITNPFTNFVFSIENGYTHGALFFVLYVVVAFYIIADFCYIIYYREQLQLRRIAALCSMAVLCLVAIVLHVIWPAQLVECFAIGLSLLVVSIGVQRPEDRIDTFTGLFKHSAYGYDMKRAFLNGKHAHIVMFNIGNYAVLKTMLGYETSTIMLSVIAGRLQEINRKLRARAGLYYLDSGRFRMVFSERDREKAEIAAQEVLDTFTQRLLLNSLDINLVPCVVLARCPEEIESFASLMAFGNNFHEKFHCTNRYIPAADAYNPNEFGIQNNIDSIIENAILNDKFEVYYQPIYSIRKRKYVSAEALLRLFDDRYGFISPELIVTAAEKSGAIHKIGELVFEKVCRFIASSEYRQLGLDYIEVNLSVAQCMRGDLADKILATMQKYNVRADDINLEITETAISYSQRAMADNLDRLSSAGLSFSLDDYGTGYSNMKRLISLPLKIVKLDKSFVDEQHNPKMWVFLQSTVKMLKDMEMEIVVEGIETPEMVEAFSNLNCDFIQGYFFSKPIPKDNFVHFILAARGGKDAKSSNDARGGKDAKSGNDARSGKGSNAAKNGNNA